MNIDLPFGPSRGIAVRTEQEAIILQSLLDEEDISCYVQAYSDSVYDGLFQLEMGWGQVHVKEDHRIRAEDILKDIRNSNSDHEEV
jgi:hypothetical protein